MHQHQISQGMDVYGADGQKIGSVARLWPGTPGTGAASGPAETIPTAAAGGWFEVDQGGILGIGASHLYIPDHAVAQVILADQRVDLKVSKSDAEKTYDNKPAFLQSGGARPS